MSDMIKIILVDDHQMFRDGLKAVLTDQPYIQMVADLSNAKDLYELLKTNEADLIITDITMPEISGIELTEYVQSHYPGIKILILSMHSDEKYIVKALKAGANGYLPKETGMSELLKAVQTIHQGENYFNKSISDTILYSIGKPGDPEHRTIDKKLTNREREIVRLVVEGLSNKEIASRLFISIRTVDSHKNHIMQKLQLKSTVDLVKYAIKHKLASID
jgi:DNA-binding NarL/FixJ family response regulator